MRRQAKTKAFVVLALIAAVLFPSSPAHACSCMEFDPQTLLDQPDSAFIGVAREVVATPSEEYQESVVVRFDIEREIKGEAGEQAHLLVKNSSDSCGDPQLVPGTRYSGEQALVQVYDGRAAEACTSLDPGIVDGLRKGLDPPNPTEPAIAISIGEERGTHMRMIAADGVVAAYVQDDKLSDTSPQQHALCPNGTVASVIAGDDGPQIRVRDLSTLEFLDFPAGAGASATSEIRACTENQQLLLAHETDLSLVDETGVLQRFDFGHERSGMVNTTGTQFGRWREFRVLETMPVSDSPSPETTTIEVRNHTGWGVYPSPDGTRHALFISNPNEAELTLMIVPHDGSTPQEIIVDSGPTNPIHWFDDTTIISGSAVVDLSTTPATITQDERLTPRSGPTVYNSSIQYGDGSTAIINHFTGERVSLGRQFFTFEGTLQPLFQSTMVTGTGFIPPERQDFPLTGEPVPASLEDLRSIAPDVRTFNVVEPPEEDTAALEEAELAVEETQQAPPTVVTGPTSPRWPLVAAIALLFVVGAVLLRRRTS